jgi:hypothetical protein
MWYKKADAPEFDVMHGTGNVESIRSKSFVCDIIFAQKLKYEVFRFYISI